MSIEYPSQGNVESSGEKRMMSWEELIQSAEQGKCNETEMEALKLQAQTRLEHLKNTLPEGSSQPSLAEVSFEVDFSKKQVLRAILSDVSRNEER